MSPARRYARPHAGLRVEQGGRRQRASRGSDSTFRRTSRWAARSSWWRHKSGSPVAIFALHSGVAGAYLERSEGSVVLQHALDPAVRLRFTLAHELGHHELGHGAAVDTAATLYWGLPS